MVTRCLNQKKHMQRSAKKIFKRLGQINDQLYEVQLAKTEIEHKGPIIVGFFVLQYSKLRMLELHYYSFRETCVTDKNEEMEIVTVSLCLLLAEKKLYACIRSEKMQEWELLHRKDCIDSFTADSCNNFLPETYCAKDKKNFIRECLDRSWKNFDALKSCICVARHTAVTSL